MLERSQLGLRLSLAQSGWPAVDAVALDAVAGVAAMSLVDLLGCAHAVAPKAATAREKATAEGLAVGRRIRAAGPIQGCHGVNPGQGKL